MPTRNPLNRFTGWRALAAGAVAAIALVGAALVFAQGTGGAGGDRIQRSPLRCTDAWETGLLMTDYKDDARAFGREIGRALEDKAKMTTAAGQPVYADMTKKLREFVEYSEAVAAELEDYDLAKGLVKKVGGVAESLKKARGVVGAGKDPAKAYGALKQARGVLQGVKDFPVPES